SIGIDEIKAEAIETLTAAGATADPRFVAEVTDLLGQMQDPSSRARVALSLVELGERRDAADTVELARRTEAALREFRGRPRIELLGGLPGLLAAAARLSGNPQT